MDFNNPDWKSEALGKKFIPGSLDAKLVEDTLERIGQVVDIKGKEKVLSQIINVALFDAMELMFDRFNIDKEGRKG